MQAEHVITPTDPTQGLALVSAIGTNREQERYLFTAGNTLDPDHILERDWVTQWNAEGGEEIETNCFRRTLHGYLPRATFIPMEVWTRSMPQQFISEGAEENTVKIVTAITPEALDIQPQKPRNLVSSLTQPNLHVKFYPGDELARVMRNNRDRGVVHVEALQGMGWYGEKGEPGVAQVLNADFFPTRPIQLSRIEEMVDSAASRSDLHRKVARSAKQSCQVFRRYAETQLAAKHILFRSTNPTNFSYVYSGTERSFLAQLEMQPQDIQNSDAMMRIMEKMAAQGVGENAQGASPELIGQIAAAVVRELAQGEKTKPRTAKDKDKSSETPE